MHRGRQGSGSAAESAGKQADADRRAEVSLIVPIYREKAKIPELIAGLNDGPFDPEKTEIVFVDDGSDDDSGAVLSSRLGGLEYRHKLLVYPSNRGKGRAVRCGMLAACGEVLVFLDADLSARPQEAARLVDVLYASGADVVIGSRRMPRSRVVTPQSRSRRLLASIFHSYLVLLGLTRWKDTQCGLKAFRRGAVAPLFGPLRTEGFAFDIEILYRARRLGFEVVESGIVWAHAEDSTVRPLADGLRMATDALRIRLTARTPRVAVPLDATNARIPDARGGGTGAALDSAAEEPAFGLPPAR